MHRRVTGRLQEGYRNIREGYLSVQEGYWSSHKSAKVEIPTYERDLVDYWR